MDINLLDLLKQTPLFSAYPDSALKTLQAHLIPCQFQKNEWIVKENEVVDSIYWITQGTAEVYSSAHLIKKIRHRPLAILRPQETIGLDTHRLYSTSGLRTASVRASEMVHTFKLEISHLKIFLEQYGILENQEVIEKIHRLLLIKRSLPFQKLHPKKLLWLENQIHEKYISAGTLIFDQDDLALECYLIDSGEVEIRQHQNQAWKTLAILTSPAFFGEMALLADAPRNAQAIAKTDCKLLTLKKEDLFKILIESKEASTSFAQLFHDRIKPVHLKNILIYHPDQEELEISYILKNPETGQYFKLSEIGHTIFQLLDGNHTLSDIVFEIAEQHQHFIPTEISDLIAALRKSGFLESPDSEKNSEKKGIFYFLNQSKNLLNMRYTFGKTNLWIKNLYCKGLHLYFHRSISTAKIIIIFIGLSAFFISSPKVIHGFFEHHVSLLWLLALIPFTLISTALHEFAHALTTTHHGKDVHYIGIGLQWGYPTAFTDTSDMWIAPPKDRIQVNLSGVLQDCLTASIAGLFTYFSSSQTLCAIFWIFAALTLLRCIAMMNPLENSDGYFLLMDMLEKPKLRLYSNLYLMNLIRSLKNVLMKKSDSLEKKINSNKNSNFQDYSKNKIKLMSKIQNLPEKIFWIYTVFFIFLTTALAYGIQWFLMNSFGMNIHPIFKLILPLCLILMNCAQVMKELSSRNLF